MFECFLAAPNSSPANTHSPVDSVDPLRQFDAWEIILYTMTFAFFLEELVKITKVGLSDVTLADLRLCVSATASSASS